MRTRFSAAARGGFTVLAAGLVTALAGLGFASLPAAAHATLISSTPEDGAVLAEPPTEIVLEFDDDVLADFTQVAVLDVDDSNHEQGEPEVDGTRVTQSVGSLEPGEYRVSYRVGSSDGHPVSGVVTFSVTMVPDENGAAEHETGPTTDAATGQPTEEASPSPDPEPAAASGDGDAAADDDTLLWIAGAAAVLVSGAAVTFLLTRRPGGGSDETPNPGP